MKYSIAVIKGDGIGPEIVDSAIRVLKHLEKKHKIEFIFNEYLAGGCAIDKYNTSLPEDTIKGCLESDSVLLGAVGGPKWDDLSGNDRPEKALLGLRKELNVFANLRPAYLNSALKDSCVLRKDIVDKGFDILIVRELTGGIYFGKHETKAYNGIKYAIDEEKYTEDEIRRVALIAFETAKIRRKKVTSIDKANVLDTSKLWRSVVLDVSKDYNDIEFENMLVDNAAMQLIRNPSSFDVILTSNMFGDILSDEASQITGSIGLLPSASLGKTKRGLYEPIHGSAPDIAGKNIANPIATIYSCSLMLKYSFGRIDLSEIIDNAIEKTLNDGYRTLDIYNKNNQDETLVSTSKITDIIISNI